MKLNLEKAQEIAKKLKSKNVQAMVGAALDKVFFYVYSIDPLIKCNCNRKAFDLRAKQLLAKEVSEYDNVRIAVTGPAKPAGTR